MPKPPTNSPCEKKCGGHTRHKSGVCEPCRKKEKKKCANQYCKRAAMRGDLCTKHYRYMLKKEEQIGVRVDGSCEVLDREFDDGVYY